MTGAERVIAQLRSGPKTQAELYAATRCMVHSRVADLRRKGYVIECDKTAGYTYSLISEPHLGSEETGAQPGDGTTRRPVPCRSFQTDSSPVQLSLFSPGAYGEAA